MRNSKLKQHIFTHFKFPYKCMGGKMPPFEIKD